MTDKTSEKIPIPPVPPSQTLSKSIEFWSKVLTSLDRQFQYMEENMCYGKIAVEFKFWGGKMTDKTSTIVVNDRIVNEKKI